MRLVDNVQAVVRHSWSFHLNVLLALASGVDAALSYYADGRAKMSLIVFAWTSFSAILRLIPQEKVSGPAATSSTEDKP